MPVGFNSPARNLFLLGSTGAQLVSNFFKTIDRTAGTDGVYLPDEIKYNVPDQKYILAGTASDSQSKDFGWFEKRDEAGVAEWETTIQSTLSTTDTTLRALEIDNNDNLIVVGKTGSIPWVAKYTNGGSVSWQSTTSTADLEYSGIAIDTNNNIYACGNTPTPGSSSQAFIEKFDSSGVPGWGKSAFMLGRDVILTKCAANSRGEVVAVGIIEDDSAFKGYVVKINANTGEVLWDRTIRSYEPDISFGYEPVFCEDVYIDANDQIYIVGRLFGISETRSFIIKYTAEGNMLWQRETPAGETIQHYYVKSDTETEQTIVYSQYFGIGGMISKYSKNGDLVFRRVIYSSFNSSTSFGPKGLDADPSNYYLLFVDDPVDLLSGDPKRYTFGKVSSSGNGLGNFTYSEGTGQSVYYQSSSIQDKIGRLSDGSVRQDTSDLLAYPFSANKLLFDDLATQVSNKKRQMDTAGSFQYSGSPAIRVADFQEFNLLGEVYSGSGNWLDQSGKGNDGVINGATWNAGGWWNFDGTNDYIDFPSIAVGNTYTIECTFNSSSVVNYRNVYDMNYTTYTGISGNVGPRFEQFTDGTANWVWSGVTTANDPASFTTPFPLSANTWYHTAFVMNNGTVNTYVNGLIQNSNVSSPNGYVTTFGDPNLGRGFVLAGTRYFSGKIGSFRIYNRALTAAQVYQNYNATNYKYGGRGAVTAPKLIPGIVSDSSLRIHLDFKNALCYSYYANSNLLTYSDYSSGNVAENTTITLNATIAPDGSNTAISMDGNTGTSMKSVYKEYNANPGAYTTSVYAKYKSERYIALGIIDSTNVAVWAIFDILNGVISEGAYGSASVTNKSFSITSSGNGWYRLSVSGGFTTFTNNLRGARVWLTNYGTTPSTNGVYLWGPQLSFGSNLLPYLPTRSTAITPELPAIRDLSSYNYPAGASPTAVYNASNGRFDFNGNQDNDISFSSGYPGSGYNDPISIETWFIGNSPVNSSQVIGTVQGTTTAAYWLFMLSTNGAYNLTLQAIGTTYGIGTTTRPNPLTGWKHFVATYNGGDFSQLSSWKIYVNGVSQTTQITGNASVFGPGSSANATQIGTISGGTSANRLSGSIGQYRVYHKALTASEVSRNFNATRSRYGV